MDIASLGFGADTSGLDRAGASLDAVATKAGKTDTATARFRATMESVNATAKLLGQAAASLATATDRLATSLGGAQRATATLDTATQRVSVTFNTNASAVQRATQATQASAAADLQAAEAKTALAAATERAEAINIVQGAVPGAQRSSAEIDAGIQAAGLAAAGGDLSKGAIATEAAEASAAIPILSRLKSSIGTVYDSIRDAGAATATKYGLFGLGTAAELEQGAEAVTKVGGAARVSSLGVRELVTVGRELSAGNYTRLAGSATLLAQAFGLLNIALPIAIVGFAAVAEATHNFNDAADDTAIKQYADSLGLTTKQIEAAGGATITYMDTIHGFFATLKEDTGVSDWLSSIGSNIQESITEWIKSFFDFASESYGLIVGSYKAITQVWSDLPGFFKNLLAITINDGIKQFATFTNSIIDAWNTVKSAVGDTNVTAHIAPKGITTNTGAAAATNVQTAFSHEIANATTQAHAYLDKFYKDWGAQSTAAAKARLKDYKDDHPGRKPRTGGDSTALDGFDTIENSAQNDTLKLSAQAQAYKMTALEAATFEEKTKLLNEASSKGLTLTAAQTDEINKLAAAYGAAKVAADDAKALFDIDQEATKATDALNDQAATIGLVGRQLAFVTEMQKQLNEYNEKTHGVTPTAEVMSNFTANANSIADKTAANDNAKAYNTAITQGNEQISTLSAQAGALRDSTDAQNDSSYAQKLLNDEIYRGIQYSPMQISALEATNKAQTALNNQITNTKDALDFVKQSATGFVTSLQQGLQQGESFFEAFGKSVLQILDSIIQKLLNVSIDAATGGSSGGVTGFLGSLGKALGIGGPSINTALIGADASQSISSALSSTAIAPLPLAFAKGGAFSNSIVTSPTLFKFANGTAMGEMGEAGPEAIMPLKRGNDGSLGVQMYGQQSKSGDTHFHQGDVNQTFPISGAIDVRAIQQQIQKTAEQTKQDIKKAQQGWAYEFQQNGATVG